jgi:hypothetical protein
VLIGVRDGRVARIQRVAAVEGDEMVDAGERERGDGGDERLDGLVVERS